MPSALAFIGGGLLEGVGKGLVETGKEKRKLALAELDHKRNLERDDKRLEGRRGLLGQQIEADDARAARTDANAIGRLDLQIGSQKDIAAGRDRTALGVASINERRASATATSAADARQLAAETTAKGRVEAAKVTAGNKDTTAAEDRIIERSVETDENGNERVNHEAAAVELEAAGFKKAAAAQRRKAKAIDNLDIRKRAEEFADARVDEQAGTFSGDESDFKEDGGSRVKFRARMVREFIAENSGQTQAPATQPAAAATGPYTGDAPPANVPDARKSPKDGFWYVKRDGKWQQVQK